MARLGMIGGLMALGAGAAVAGCATAQEAPASAGGRYMAGHFHARAVLHTADGADAGTALVEEVPGGLKVTVTAKGLPTGIHGVHIHTTGKCDAPGFTTAGGHWNPAGKQHGMQNPMGAHAGDLPNLEVAADGTATLSFTETGATYEALLDEDGAALVVHAGADDLKTDPSGNSGARIACGVFEAL
ncbi:MAG: superoxide dismutase family protein [Sphingomonas sp.]